jgi:branched-chain amino acid transport system permease protein
VASSDSAAPVPAAPTVALLRAPALPLPTVALVGVTVAAGLACAQLHGKAGPWAVGALAVVVAAVAFSGRIDLPADPLVRHLLVALVGGGLALLFTDKVGSFTDFQAAQVAYFLPAVAGLNFLTGLNGQLSLGHGALMAVGGYTTAVMMYHQPHVPIVVVLLAAIVVTGAAGAVVGIAAARLRGPYLGGATLALAVALPEVATRYATLFGGEQGLHDVPRPLTTPGWLSDTFTSERWLAWVGIACGVLTLLLLANLDTSSFGRRLRTVRDDETAASLVGISVARTQIGAFVISASCAGLAGALYGLANNVVNPAGFSLTLSFALLTGIVVGGLGTLAGSLWGAIALVYVPRATNGVSNHFKLGTSVKGNLPLAIYGVVLALAMLLFPEGIQGGVRRLRRLVPRRGEGVSAEPEVQPGPSPA